MNADDGQDAYSHVDDADDPQRLVAMMDHLRSMDPFMDVKRQNFAFLYIQPGHRLLDVGSGPGDDVRALAEMTGAAGHVVGVDASATMVATAKERSTGSHLSVEFVQGDATHLPFDDDIFDGSRSDRMMQHLDHPARALAEMVRVTRPGGRIVVSDTDWGMQAIDVDDRELTNRIFAVRDGTLIRSPWVGRRLPRLFAEVGLADVTVVPHAITSTSFDGISPFLPTLLGAAQERNAITSSEAESWMRGLEQRVADGLYFAALVMFTVAGTKR